MTPMRPSSDPAVPNPASDRSGVPADVWTILRRDWRTIVLVTLLSCSGALTLAWQMTPGYRAETLLTSVEERDDLRSIGGLLSRLGGLTEIKGLSLKGLSDTDSNIAFLSSRALIESFIQENDLIPVLVGDCAAGRAGPSGAGEPESAEASPCLWEAYRLVATRILRVEVDRRSGLITLSIDWRDRRQAAEWANKLVLQANALLRAQAIGEADRSLARLEAELRGTLSQDVRLTIYRLTEALARTRVMAGANEPFAFRVIDPAGTIDADGLVRPRRGWLLAAGLVGGVALGALAAFARTRIRTAREGYRQRRAAAPGGRDG